MFVNEFLNSTFELEQLFCIDASEYIDYEKCTIISEADLKKISNLTTPNNVVAIFKIPTTNFIEKGLKQAGFQLLDIIRTKTQKLY